MINESRNKVGYVEKMDSSQDKEVSDQDLDNNLSKSKIRLVRKLSPQSGARRAEGSETLHQKWSSEAVPTRDEDGVEIIRIDELSRKGIADLLQVAKAMDLSFDEDEVTKQKIINKIVQHSITSKEAKIWTAGVLEKMQEGYGFLRSPEYNYLPGTDDVYVSPYQIRNFGLRTGDTVMGEIKPSKPSDRYFAVTQIYEVNFQKVDKKGLSGSRRVSFDALTPAYPEEKLCVEYQGGDVANRFIDLFSPIGKGQRGVIVSPPKAGKTTIVKAIANAIAHNHPECYLIVLLIDERPEEVTDMKRSVKAEVVSSTFDEPAARHVCVAKMVLEKAKRLVEQKIDVVILLDSLTRLARAYNQVEPTSGKVLSGGVDANALHKPKRFFGAARNVLEGGSLTIVATALVDTGSKMDEVIFEEFKGTGNMELVLSRSIAERRLYPAINIKKSGTRKEELLLTSSEIQKMYALRNALSMLDEVESHELVHEKMKLTKDNEHFLKAMNSGM